MKNSKKIKKNKENAKKLLHSSKLCVKIAFAVA